MNVFLHKLGASALVFALALVAGTGCGYSAGDLCDDVCDCSGCSDAAYDECLDNEDDLERSAYNEGCDDQYEEYMACRGDEFRCVNSQVDLDGCKFEKEGLDNCRK